MIMQVYPVYFLQLGDSVQVVFPKDKEDIGHTEFWETIASSLIAKHYRMPQATLVNLPYCQRRARIVGNKCYYGETPDPELLDLIRQAVGNKNLAFVHDDHERRLKEDVVEFRKLVRRYRPKSTTT
jgi:hypothetical protein